MPSDRYVITAAYGRCIEGMRRVREDMVWALRRGDDAECLALAQDLRDWARVAREVPQFVEGA